MLAGIDMAWNAEQTVMPLRPRLRGLYRISETEAGLYERTTRQRVA
jgi:hypothetical protein